MHSQPIASIELSAGTTRLVYEDAHGQYVIGDEGEPVFGVWYVRREELNAMFGPQPIIASSIDVAQANLRSRSLRSAVSLAARAISVLKMLTDIC